MLTKLLKGDVRQQIAFVTALVLLAAVITLKNPEYLIRPAIAVVVSVLLDQLFVRFFYKKHFFPTSAVVTGLLIGSVLPNTAALWLFVVVPAITILGKHLLELVKFSNLHIFNPAAAGMILAQLLFGDLYLAWWTAAAMPWLTVLIVLVGAGYVLKRLRRLALPIGFLLAYAIILAIKFQDPNTVLTLLFDGTPFFFAFIMLPEPQSSPATGHWKYTFGILVAVILAVLLEFKLQRFDVFLTALLIADLASFVIRYISGKIPKFRPIVAKVSEPVSGAQ